MSEHYPKFISTLPLGDDKLKGNAHDNIAKSISNIIKNQSHEIKKQIIGLEGDWGSGKSNIIKIIQKDEDNYLKSEEYLHFIYDSWGHQEDLNRRALLEEIIDFLDYKTIIPKNQEWIKKKKELNGKMITSVKNIFPEIKIFWIFFIISFLAYNFSKSIFHLFEFEDVFPNVFFGKWKEIISIWLFPTFLFAHGIYFLITEIINQIEKNDKRNHKLTKQQLIGQIFYLINGKEIESNTTDYVIENEPTNKEFRRFLKDINKELSIKEKSLILTIDNIDRLSKEKVKALWSTINIFFAENSENELYDNIWLIIPYDESKIVDCFTENEDKEIGRGLIDKTFAVKFRVTPPLFSNWEQLLEENLLTSFGSSFISNKTEVHFIKRIFDNYISDSVIKPRQIINYVNDIVTLHLQFSEINFRYLALFSMTKNDILGNEKANPNEMILSKLYINDNTRILFKDDIELDKSIAAIVFGVSLEDAEEVLLDRKIESILMNGKINDLNSFVETPSFPAFFEKKFTNISFQNIALQNIELIPDVLNKIEDLKLIEINILNNYWINLNDRLINNDYFHEKFYGLHKKIMLKDIKLGKSIFNKCVDVLYKKVNNETSEKEYINQILEINTFLIDNVKNVSLSDLKLKQREIETSNYFHLIEIDSENYKNYNLTCTDDKILKYFYDNAGKLDITALYSNLDSIKILKSEIDLSILDDDLKSGIEELNNSNINDSKFYYECLLVITDKKPLENIIIANDIIESSLAKVKTEDPQVFALLLAFALKNATDLSTSYHSTIFKELHSDDESVAISVASKIENIITFQKIIEIIVENSFNYSLPQNIVKELVLNNQLGNSLNISWVLKKFTAIKGLVFENNEEITKKFFKKISNWNTYLNKNLDNNTLEFKDIDLLVFDYTLKIDNSLSQTLFQKSNEFLKSLDRTEYYQIFDNVDMFTPKLFRKLNDKKIDSEVYTQKTIPYLIEYLKDFASGRIDLKNSQALFLKNILRKLDESATISFYKNITDCLNSNSNLNSAQIAFFIEPILKNNLLIKKPDDSVNGVLKILITDSFLYAKYFSTYYKNYIDIIAKAKVNKSFGITTIREKLKNYSKEKDMRVYANKKLPNWSKLK